MLGTVAKALYGVPAYAALHDVAVQVVSEAQVLVDGEPVGGHLFAFVAGAAAAEVSAAIGVEQVAGGVEGKGFQVPARGGQSACSVFLGGEDAAQLLNEIHEVFNIVDMLLKIQMEIVWFYIIKLFVA